MGVWEASIRVGTRQDQETVARDCVRFQRGSVASRKKGEINRRNRDEEMKGKYR